MAIIRHTIPTTNYSKGRGGNKIDKIVIHWIVGSLASADATFKNPQRKASAHYGIENTKIIQWVAEKDTAWHASNFAVNQQSIGIEHSATPKRPATESTHKTSGKLVGEIAKRYNIKLDTAHIVPHKKYSNTQCPGTMNIGKIIKYAKEADMFTDTSGIFKVTLNAASWNASAVRYYKDFKSTLSKFNKLKSTIQSDYVTKKVLAQSQDRYEKILNDHEDTIEQMEKAHDIEIEGLKKEIKAFKDPKGPAIPRVSKNDNWWSRFWKPIIRAIFTYKTKK